jgi:hypothetical protein
MSFSVINKSLAKSRRLYFNGSQEVVAKIDTSCGECTRKEIYKTGAILLSYL